MTGDDAATAAMTGREQKALNYLCVVLNGLLLIIAPKFASERGIAQLAFWLKWRRWAAGSFGPQLQSAIPNPTAAFSVPDDRLWP